MQNNLGLKLIAVLDINTLKLYEAKGLKITKKIDNHLIHSDVNHRPESHQGLTQKRSLQGSAFDPHTAPKDIEHQESARTASSLIEKEYNTKPDYKELIIVSDPKMLGYLRKTLGTKMKRAVTKEVNKDLVNHDIEAIEKTIFN